MNNRTTLLVLTMATLEIAGLACNGARFRLLGGAQDAGAPT